MNNDFKGTTAILTLLLGFIGVKAAFAQEKGEFTDSRDNKTYKTVKIDNQTWMAENLNYEASGSYCYDYYGDDEYHCEIYGRLYTWAAAIDVCPDGWHLPSREEWQKLIRSVDEQAKFDGEFDDKNIAGTKLKSATGWNGKNNYGFAALPAGRRSYIDSFHDIGSNGYWWSATELDGNAWNRYIVNSIPSIKEYNSNKSSGFSVRCVKD